MEYSQYVRRWLEGVQDEILFWEDYMANEGGNCFRSFDWTVKPDKRFELEDELEGFDKGQIVRFLDVGSGPFSRCGYRTDKVNLAVTAVDPLAGIYNRLKEQYHLENGLSITTGFLELLHRMFEEDSFDIVHMSNSMDHSFDPILGIYELLYICKVNGKVILRHAENEAENARYSGLHQWNLSTHRKDGDLIIWNRETEISINEIVREYADIIIESDIEENADGHWVYNKVTMIKKKPVPIPQDRYYDDLLWEIYDFLLGVLRNSNKYGLQKIDERLGARRKVQKKLMNMKRNPEKYREKLKELFPKGLSIYGFGNVGKTLFDVCQSCGAVINKVIDRDLILYAGTETIPFDSYYCVCDHSIVVTLV